MARYIVLGLIFVFLLSGCSFKDIDKRLFVLAFGVDQTENDKEPFHLSLKVSMPNSERSGSIEKSPVILEAKGESLSDAVQKIRTKVDKELDFGHAKLIILGKDVLPGQVEYLSNWFFRQADIQQVTWVAIADEKAIDVLKVNPKTVSQPSNVLVIAFERTGVENPYLIQKYLFQYRREYLDEGVDPVLPVIKVEGDEQIIETAAVFGKNGELLMLDQEQARLLNVLNQNVSEFEVNVKLNKNLLTMRAEEVNSSFTINSTKGATTIQVSIKLQGYVEESFEQLTTDELREAEKLLEQKITGQVEELLKLFQEKKLDPLQFGLRYRSMQWNKPNSAEQWKELYPEVTFKVDTKVRIRTPGIVK